MRQQQQQQQHHNSYNNRSTRHPGAAEPNAVADCSHLMPAATPRPSTHDTLIFLLTTMHRTRPQTRSISHTPQWPLLKRRSQPSTPSNPPPPSPKRDPRVMLVLQGLSPSLTASDFYRLAPRTLSAWHTTISKVQHIRDPTTLAPLGRYHITFAHAAAATAYRDTLLRLHRLARHKARSSSGLWESTIPTHLRSEQDPAAEVSGFAVALGTQDLDVQRRRVSTNGWTKNLRHLVGEAAGETPHVVLVGAYPPTLAAGGLARAIREDGRRRGFTWKVSSPRCLHGAGRGENLTGEDGTVDETTASARKGGDALEQQELESRFVVVCADEMEARRFHRHWNQKTIVAGPEDGAIERNVLDVSIIKW